MESFAGGGGADASGELWQAQSDTPRHRHRKEVRPKKLLLRIFWRSARRWRGVCDCGLLGKALSIGSWCVIDRWVSGWSKEFMSCPGALKRRPYNFIRSPELLEFISRVWGWRLGRQWNR